MATTRDLLKILDEDEKSPLGGGMDLRMDLMDIILRGLEAKGWTKKELAERVGVKPSFLTRLIHCQANSTFDVVARVLHALGLRPKLLSVPVHAGVASQTPTTRGAPASGRASKAKPRAS